MEAVKTALRRVGRVIRKIRDWSSGDDLYEAQSHRGDDHDFHINPGAGM